MQNYHTIESSTPQESYKYYEGDRRMHRMLQPSLLSAENTMQLAGRNIVSKWTSIFPQFLYFFIVSFSHMESIKIIHYNKLV